MSLMEVLPGWLQEEMEYDPRERDFRRDFYEDDLSKAIQLLRSKAVEIGKREIMSERVSTRSVIPSMKLSSA